MTGKLHFNAGALDLIDNLPMPVSVIINNREYFRNRRMHEDGTSIHQIIDSLDASGEPCTEYGITICGRSINTRLMRNNDLEFVIPEISFNSTPGHLVLSGCGIMHPDFTDCIRNFNSLAGIREVMLVDDNPAIIETYVQYLNCLATKFTGILTRWQL